MDYPFLLSKVQKAVLETGAFIRQEQQAFERHHAEYKGHNDLVSYVDRSAEERLMSVFSKLMPESGSINEEGGTTNPNSEFTWIVDPLDGTTNFVCNLPLYCVSVGLRHQNKIVLSCIYIPKLEEMFTAYKGGGALMNGKPIRVSATPKLGNSLIATGFPFRRSGNLRPYLGLIGDFMSNSMGMRRFGSAAIDLAYTAMGRFDGFYETHLKPWDVAAGCLLIEEAGGKVSQFDGQPYDVFDETLLVSNGKIHDEMVGLIRPYLAEKFTQGD